MPAFNVEVSHTLGQDTAFQRLEGFVDKVRQHYRDQVSSVEGAWSGNVLDFSMVSYGFTLSGKLTIEETRVLLQGQLPFAAIAFRGKIEQSFASALRKAVGG